MNRTVFSVCRECRRRARRATGLVLVAAVLSTGGCAPRREPGGAPVKPPTGPGVRPGTSRRSSLPRPKGVGPLASAGHTDSVHSVAFLPGGERLLTEGADGSVRIWKARTGEQMSRYILDDGWEKSRCAVAGGLLAFARLGDVRILEADTGAEIGMVSDMPGETRPAFSPGGKLLAVDNGYGKVTVLDAGTLAELQEFDLTGSTLPGGIGPFVFASDGGFLAVVRRREVHLCEVKTGRLTGMWPLGKSVHAVSAV
ncbi:MAG: WD40 repeat domain-containing protein, partial [Planctomycetota bacterium]